MAHYFEIVFTDATLKTHQVHSYSPHPASSFYETKSNSLPTCSIRVSIFYITPYPFALIPQDP